MALGAFYAPRCVADVHIPGLGQIPTLTAQNTASAHTDRRQRFRVYHLKLSTRVHKWRSVMIDPVRGIPCLGQLTNTPA